jgi:WD40 repeat protein
MSQINKYLLFIGVLVSVLYATANFNLTDILGSKTSQSAPGQKSFRKPYVSKKPTSTLSGFDSVPTVDYSPLHNLTAAAADTQITVWQLPETAPLQEIDAGADFQAQSLRFIPGSTLLVVGGVKSDASGAIRFFDAVTGEARLQLDEPEPIQSLDPHPGGRFLMATADSYIKIIDMKDGNTVTVLQKNSPAARGYYYGNGQYLLQSDSLSLFDLSKRSSIGTLDTVTPLLFKKGLDGTTFGWLTAEGVTVMTTAQKMKRFFPLDTKGVTAFDVEKEGSWGLFLLDSQKLAVINLSTGKAVKTIALAASATDVTISPDGSSAYVAYSTGTVAVYDIGQQNKIKKMKQQLKNLFGSTVDKLGQYVKPLPK